MGSIRATLTSILSAAALAAPAMAGMVTVTEDAKLLASDGAEGDWFGWSVSVSGDTTVVGAYFDDDGGANWGSAYVFVGSGSSWSEEAKLTVSQSGGLGYSVSVSGETAVVGAPADDDNGDRSGAAYVFVRSGSSWSEEAKLTASDAAADDRFGDSVSVSGDTVVVMGGGSAYVFVRDVSSWSEQAKLTASDDGGPVSVSGDTAIVGAPGGDGNEVDSGAAYVFVRSGSSWSEQAKLTASDGAADDYFGTSVSVSGDTVVVGADGDDDNGYFSGSAYVFVRSGSSWSEQAKLTALDGTGSDDFGCSVSVSGDTVVVGAEGDSASAIRCGSAYVFVRSGSSWSRGDKLTASDAADFDSLGRSVSVSGDTVVVGNDYDDDNGDNSGSAYVFDLAWLRVISGVVTGDVQQGVTVSLSGDASGTTVSAADGSYSFAGLSDGNYAVTPSLAGYAFTPASSAVTVSGADVVGIDFMASLMPVISGVVTGDIQQGVTVTLSGDASGTTVSAADGSYSFLGMYDGNYLVTPSLAGYAFTPACESVTVSGADVTGVDFVAQAVSVSGVVTGDVQSGVTLTLSGAASATTSSAADGSYSFSAVPDGNCVVTPSLAGYVFTPASRSVTVSGVDVSGIDFAAQAVVGDNGGCAAGPGPSHALFAWSLVAAFALLVRRRVLRQRV